MRGTWYVELVDRALKATGRGRTLRDARAGARYSWARRYVGAPEREIVHAPDGRISSSRVGIGGASC